MMTDGGLVRDLWAGDELSLWRPPGCATISPSTDMLAYIVRRRIKRVFVEPCNKLWLDLLRSAAKRCDGNRSVEVLGLDENGLWAVKGVMLAPLDRGQLFEPSIRALRRMRLPHDVLVCAANIVWWETQEENPYLYEWTSEMATNVNRRALEDALRAVGYTKELSECIGK